MAGFIERLITGKSKSADEAKERLKFVLIHDRTDISPDSLNQLKNEIIRVISHYVDIDPEAVHIDITQEGREQRLVADIPLRVKHRRRIG
jgi:cell division topological specificity factor